MLRNTLVVLLMIGLTFVLVSVVVGITIGTTSWGRSIAGREPYHEDSFKVLERAYYYFLLLVFAPIVGLTSVVTAKLTSRPRLSAVLSIMPISLLASGFRIELLWATAGLILFGFVAARVGANEVGRG